MQDPQQEHMRSSGLGAMACALMIASIVGFGALATVTRFIGAAAIPIWVFAALAAVAIFKGPLGHALATRISGRIPDPGPAEIAPEVYAELDELRARVGELEERVDFSERLLTQKNDTRVPGSSS